MNKHSDTTPSSTTPDFPIPYINQEPIDDLITAKTMFKIVDRLLDRGCEHGLSKEAVFEISALFCTAREYLDPIQRYLDTDTRPGTAELYRAARRAEIVKSYERGRA